MLLCVMVLWAFCLQVPPHIGGINIISKRLLICPKKACSPQPCFVISRLALHVLILTLQTHLNHAYQAGRPTIHCHLASGSQVVQIFTTIYQVVVNSESDFLVCCFGSMTPYPLPFCKWQSLAITFVKHSLPVSKW